MNSATVGSLLVLLAAASGGQCHGAVPSTGRPGALVASEGGYAPWVHDPSTIIRCGDEFWLFATGTGVKALRSKDLATWREGPAVFSTAPAWTREVVANHRSYFWAPDVIQAGGCYLLYYSVSSWGKNTSAIGLASTPTLNPDDPKFGWKDEGLVIRSFTNDNFNAIDPNVVLDAEGRLWMAFGSFWSGIKLVELNPGTGKRIANDSPLHALAYHDSIEAPCLYRHGGHYFLFVNWGACCRGTDSTYEIRVGRSQHITGPYVDRDGVDLLRGGGTLLLGTSGPFIGPGHAGLITAGGDDWLSCHFYDGTRRGRATLALRKLRWTAEGWPEMIEAKPPVPASRSQRSSAP
jgi:arabinan endo-1,5-alpha-L-arabinosidase